VGPRARVSEALREGLLHLPILGLRWFLRFWSKERSFKSEGVHDVELFKDYHSGSALLAVLNPESAISELEEVGIFVAA
jgi:hypothetical protein